MAESPVTPVPPLPDPAKFRVLLRDAQGAVVRGGLELLDRPGQRWIDLTAPTSAELDLLAQRYHFHPLALEDCLHLDQRPKLEEYDGYLFVVQHAFSCGAEPYDTELHELHAFLGDGLLVTVHADTMKQVDVVLERATREASVMPRGVDFLLYLLSDQVTDSHFELLDLIADEIEELEDRILTRLARADIETIFAVKRALVMMRKAISPARDVFGALTKRGDPRVQDRTAAYFRDIYDHLVRVTEAIEADRDLLGNALDAYLSMAANRTNDIMKQLTVISVTFLPLSFLTGFFGMNFTHLPFDSRWLMDGALALCVLVPAAMLVWLKRKAWL